VKYRLSGMSLAGVDLGPWCLETARDGRPGGAWGGISDSVGKVRPRGAVAGAKGREMTCAAACCRGSGGLAPSLRSLVSVRVVLT
jgi:hypothetical protein